MTGQRDLQNPRRRGKLRLPHPAARGTVTHPAKLRLAPAGRAGASLGAIVAPVAEEMTAVDRIIFEQLSSDIALINQLGGYIVNSGGKRLRPLVVLLAARACQHSGTGHQLLAAVVEFIHTATLLHDDVVDSSDLRRGQASANQLWGNEASVLVGDFLYSRAFEMMVSLGSMRVMEVMAHTTNTIAEGEVMQLLNCRSPEVTEQRYLETIRRKTAALFEAATRLGAVLAHQSSAAEEALAAYGRHLGIAFQLVDDVLDYSGNPAEIGKNVGDDLAEGKPTLPVINALMRGTPAQQKLLREVIVSDGRERIAEVLETIESTGSLAYTARLARQQAGEARAALASIPDSPFKTALSDLALFAVERHY
jgi:octaprenyl-diphosphate synthase